MDRASSGKSDSPCLKQDQIALVDVQRLPAFPDRTTIAIPNSSRSAFRPQTIFLIAISSEPTIAITSER
jgi:hypothetical protein